MMHSSLINHLVNRRDVFKAASGSGRRSVGDVHAHDRKRKRRLASH